MDLEKDIRFSDKKVDESWKEQAERDRINRTAARKAETSGAAEKSAPGSSSPAFVNFLNSLAYQVLMHLGETPYPGTEKLEKNLDQAKEVIDLLVVLKEKTSGNTGKEEAAFFDSILPELQMKFVHNV